MGVINTKDGANIAGKVCYSKCSLCEENFDTQGLLKSNTDLLKKFNFRHQSFSIVFLVLIVKTKLIYLLDKS